MRRCGAHENVLKLFHFDLNCSYPSGTSFREVSLLVLELAVNGELFDFMMYTGSFGEDISKTYIRQLLGALDACHRQGVYHRDLKPENMLLDGNFQLKIADFGYSALLEGDGGNDPGAAHQYHQGFKTECGTRSYMAPEILAHQRYAGGPVDIWSAGCVGFIMLTGNPPFQIATEGDWWFKAIKSGRISQFWKAHERSAPVLSPGAKGFVQEMLVPDPSVRANIRELGYNRWLGEGGLTRGELRDEMEGRRSRVGQAKREADERKRREEGERQRQYACANGGYDMGQEYQIRRSVGAGVVGKLPTLEMVGDGEEQLPAKAAMRSHILLPAVGPFKPPENVGEEEGWAASLTSGVQELFRESGVSELSQGASNRKNMKDNDVKDVKGKGAGESVWGDFFSVNGVYKERLPEFAELDGEGNGEDATGPEVDDEDDSPPPPSPPSLGGGLCLVGGRVCRGLGNYLYLEVRRRGGCAGSFRNWTVELEGILRQKWGEVEGGMQEMRVGEEVVDDMI